MPKFDQKMFHSGIAEIINEESFKSRVSGKKMLKIKYGVDPTRPDIHLGHTVALWKLKMLQDLGHQIIFLIGDYTAKIGDPSGRNALRPPLSDEEIKTNAKTYLEQVGKILDIKKTMIRFNSEWFKKMNLSDLLELTAKFTVAQITERDDFAKRLKSGQDLALSETLYPVMQAYDSVMLESDVEFGGTDQKFNMLAGRDLQKKFGQKPQDIVMVEILVGLDGKTKMSKSADNYIGITEPAATMFGKVMSIPDDLIIKYFELVLPTTPAELKKIADQLASGHNPRDLKMELASRIVTLFHTKADAEKAKAEFIKIFSKKELPSDIPEIELSYGNYDLPLLLQNLGAVASLSEARRLIEQGGISIDGAKITDPKATVGVQKGMIIKIGKLKIYIIK